MFRTSAKLVLLVSASISLTGCTSFMRWVRGGSDHTRVEARQASLTPSTDSGRTFLAEGNTGLAIEAFQHALSSGEPIAPAMNGLGVAYARLGRFETAQQLFQQAMKIDPMEQKYADNYTRLMRSSALAMRHDADIAATVAKADPAPAELPAAPATALAAPGQLVRISASEFHIVTFDPAVSGASAGFRPVARFDLGKVPHRHKLHRTAALSRKLHRNRAHPAALAHAKGAVKQAAPVAPAAPAGVAVINPYVRADHFRLQRAAPGQPTIISKTKTIAPDSANAGQGKDS